MGTDTTIAGDLAEHLSDFARACRRRNLAPRTIETYLNHGTWLIEYFESQGLAVDAADLTAEHIEAYLDYLKDDRQVKSATVANRYRSLQQFCKWLAVEGLVETSPMERIRPPAVPVVPVPVIPDDAFNTLIKSVRAAGKAKRGGPLASWAAFEAKRDEAILRLFADTGMRLAELVTLTAEDINFDVDEARVLGKGRRFRQCGFDDDTAMALRRYMRERDKHPKRNARFENLDDDNDPRNGGRVLWLGPKGALTSSGVAQILARRSQAALGVRLHPHQIRHTAAHAAAAAGMSETDMMRNFGWKSDSMPKRYGASAADERARAAKRRLGLGNRFTA